MEHASVYSERIQDAAQPPAEAGAVTDAVAVGPPAATTSAAAAPPVAASNQSTSAQLVHVRCESCKALLEVQVPIELLYSAQPLIVRCGGCKDLLRAAVNIAQSISAADLRAAQQRQQMMRQAQRHAQLMQFYSPAMRPGMGPGLGSPFGAFHPSFNLGGGGGSESARGLFDLPRSMMPPPAAAHQPPPPAQAKPKRRIPREPSAYNLFVREEMKRIKQAEPSIEHKAAWARCGRYGLAMFS